MKFNTQFQMKNAKAKDHTQHKFGDLFLIIIIIIVLILKMMQNEVIKHYKMIKKKLLMLYQQVKYFILTDTNKIIGLISKMMKHRMIQY